MPKPPAADLSTRVLRLRLKDKHAPWLRARAAEVNFVWNYCNETSRKVLDAGWSAFRTMLQYKCDDAGRWFKEVNEAYSTQDCSVCASRTGPQGRDELQVRRWTCPVCQTEHDRDVNAARNIKKRGLQWLEKEFCRSNELLSAAGEAKACEPAVNEGGPEGPPEAGRGLPAGGIPLL